MQPPPGDSSQQWLPSVAVAMQNRQVDLVPGQFLPDSWLRHKTFRHSQPPLCLRREAKEKAVQGQLNLGKLVK